MSSEKKPPCPVCLGRKIVGCCRDTLDSAWKHAYCTCVTEKKEAKSASLGNVETKTTIPRTVLVEESSERSGSVPGMLE